MVKISYVYKNEKNIFSFSWLFPLPLERVLLAEFLLKCCRICILQEKKSLEVGKFSKKKEVLLASLNRGDVKCSTNFIFSHCSVVFPTIFLALSSSYPLIDKHYKLSSVSNGIVFSLTIYNRNVTCKRPFGRFCGHTSWIATFSVDWWSFVILIVNDLISDVFLDIAGENVEMPKIKKLKSSSSELWSSSIHLRKIESVASSILSGHQKLVWSQRTRDEK